MTLWLKFEVLGNISTKTNPTPYPKNNPTQYWFATLFLALLTEMESSWYRVENNQRTKILPSIDYFIAFFNEVSMAHWIMGDGYWENFDSTVFLCTKCFTLTEVSMLKNLLQKK